MQLPYTITPAEALLLKGIAVLLAEAALARSGDTPTVRALNELAGKMHAAYMRGEITLADL